MAISAFYLAYVEKNPQEFLLACGNSDVGINREVAKRTRGSIPVGISTVILEHMWHRVADAT